MATNNSWNNAIAAANSAITLNSGTNTISVSTDASATTVNLGTGGAVKAVTLGSTNSTSATTVQSGSGALNVTATGGALTINSGTGALSISNDASATTVAIATGGAVKGVTLGSTNSTSATTVQSGSGALNVTATGGALTINSGTGTLSISSDASAATVNIATGGAAKVVTLGSTNGASSLALKTGTADFSLASATGTIMSALDTGEITYPLQSSFLAYLASQVNNVTGDNTAFQLGSSTALTVIYDQNSDFNTNGTFTAPVTGRYLFTAGYALTGLTSSHTRLLFYGSASNRQATISQINAFATQAANGFLIVCNGFFMDMDAADTIVMNITVYNGTKVVDVYGDSSLNTFFGGSLIC